MDIFEKKLKAAFDYQKFEGNEKLNKVIEEVTEAEAAELSDVDLSLVAAAKLEPKAIIRPEE